MPRFGTACPFVTSAHSIPDAVAGCFTTQLRYLCSLLLGFCLGGLVEVFFFPGSGTVFPHRFMMKSLIVSEDQRKLLSCSLIFQTLEWKLSLCH